MNAPTSIAARSPIIALAGNPNAGKTSLYNALTGARQKTGNYPGVTVERRVGRAHFDDGRPVDVVDLPGSYSLTPASPDEAVARAVLLGQQEGADAPDVVVIVVDASNLDNHLCFAQELIALGRPAVLALNMIDLAERDGLTLDPERLSEALGIPVIPTVAARRRGIDTLMQAVDAMVQAAPPVAPILNAAPAADSAALHREARRIADAATVAQAPVRRWTRAIDSIVLHPVLGVLLLMGLMFLMFQAVYAWSEAPIGWMEGTVGWLQSVVSAQLPAGFVRNLLVEGVLGGVGSVIVFLPQIVILFAFILVLEASGYMMRAAFLMDGIMAKAGLSGRGFIPLLSSFACAVPGIMATRSIPDEKDRLTTLLIAPLMTCSARLPVYTVIIGAFIPNRAIAGGWLGLQGLVLFALYIAGAVSALAIAALLRRTVTKGETPGILMELPRYQWPMPRDILLGVWQRVLAFLTRAGTIILGTTVVLWLLLSYPKVPVGSPLTQTQYSYAGRIAAFIAPPLRPIGFGEDIALALVPAMAAREVAVSALATAHAIDAGDEADEAVTEAQLGQELAGSWSLATALAFLAWFVFAPQCLSTIAVARRETNGWKWPMFMVAYLFALAYLAAGATYWAATAMGLG